MSTQQQPRVIDCFIAFVYMLEWNCSYVPINHGISSEPGHQFHPWRLLSELAVEEDFVIVKLDIGAPLHAIAHAPNACLLTLTLA